MSDVIFRCEDCNELFRPTGYDSQPAFYFNRKSGSVEEIEMDDLRDFKMAHDGHKVVKLRIIDGSFCSHRAQKEPVREDYFQATDGIQTYTVRRWRKDINEPLRYEVADDVRIEVDKPIPQVQSEELKKQMIADARKLKLDEARIGKFIERFRTFVSGIKMEDMIECGLSADDPMISYAALKDEAVEAFLSYCRSLFTDEELRRLRMFIDENSEYNDVMNVQLIRSFQLTRKTPATVYTEDWVEAYHA